MIELAVKIVACSGVVQKAVFHRPAAVVDRPRPSWIHRSRVGGVAGKAANQDDALRVHARRRQHVAAGLAVDLGIISSIGEAHCVRGRGGGRPGKTVGIVAAVWRDIDYHVGMNLDILNAQLAAIGVGVAVVGCEFEAVAPVARAVLPRNYEVVVRARSSRGEELVAVFLAVFGKRPVLHELVPSLAVVRAVNLIPFGR